MELKLYLRVLQRSWWIILITMFSALNVSLLTSYLTEPIYRSEARLVVAPNAAYYESSLDVVWGLETLDRRSIVNTYKEILASPSVYGENEHFENMDSNFFAEYSIFVAVVPDTNIIRLTVDGPDPNLVVQTVDAISQQGIRYINELYPIYSFSILNPPEVGTVPITPRPLESAGLALLIGFVVGVALAFVRDQIDNTIEELQKRSTIDSESSAFTQTYFKRRVVQEITQNADESFSLGLVNYRGMEDIVEVLPQQLIDRIIQQLTEVLIEELRGRDVVGRWGVTQFAVLLPGTTGNDAQNTFKRIQAILAEPIELDELGEMVARPDPCVGITVSYPDESITEIVERAEFAVEKASASDGTTIIFLESKQILASQE